MNSEVLLDNNIISNILLTLNYDDIINYCNSYKLALSICKDTIFWQIKSSLLGINEDLFYRSNLPPQFRYLQLATLLEKDISFRSLDYVNINQFTKLAIMLKKWDLLEHALRIGFQNWELALKISAEVGNKYYIDLFLSKSGNYQAAVLGAIIANNIDLFVELYKQAPINYRWNYNILAKTSLDTRNSKMFMFIYKLPLFYEWDWSIVLSDLDYFDQNLFDELFKITNDDLILNVFLSLIRIGNIDVFNYYKSLHNPPNFSILINSANNNINTVNYLLSIAPRNYPWNWNEVIENNPKIFHYLKSFDYDFNWDIIASAAIKILDINLFRKILSDVPNNYKWNWGYLVTVIANLVNIPKLALIEDLDIQFLDYIMSVKKGYSFDWNLLVSFSEKNDRILRYIFSIAPENYKWNWNDLLIGVIQESNIDSFDYILEKIPKSYPLRWYNILLSASINLKLFIRILSIKNYNLNIHNLTFDLISLSCYSDIYYDTLEYILLNNTFSLEDYVHFLSNAKCINIFNFIGKFIPKNLDWDKLIKNINIGREGLLNNYVNSIKNLTPSDLIINKFKNNEFTNYEENKFLMNKCPPNLIYVTFFTDNEIFTTLLNNNYLKNI